MQRRLPKGSRLCVNSLYMRRVRRYQSRPACTSGYGENTHIYTIKNNKVKKVLGNSTYAPTIGHLNYVHVYKNCKYIDRGFAHTPGDYIFYKYSNGTLASKPAYTFTVGGWGAGTWMVNGKKVSRD